jgi:hypothetical protein
MTQTIAAPALSLDGLQLVGQMQLNADATWATFRGVARQEAAGVVSAVDGQAPLMRTGRRP